jgi:hypothetical protein
VPRDPRRSLIIGTIIAAVVLAVLAALVIIGIIIVFAPRRADEDALALVPAATIHRAAPSIS